MQKLTQWPGAWVALDPAAESADEVAEATEAVAARVRETQRCRLRANAYAAYHTVDHGNERAALDVALSVVEADWLALRAERDAYAEALKMIRLYARDTDARGLAAQVLHS